MNLDNSEPCITHGLPFLLLFYWFAHAPLMPILKTYFDLSPEQVKAILMLNVAITIPARIVIGD